MPPPETTESISHPNLQGGEVALLVDLLNVRCDGPFDEHLRRGVLGVGVADARAPRPGKRPTAMRSMAFRSNSSIPEMDLPGSGFRGM